MADSSCYVNGFSRTLTLNFTNLEAFAQEMLQYLDKNKVLNNLMYDIDPLQPGSVQSTNESKANHNDNGRYSAENLSKVRFQLNKCLIKLEKYLKVIFYYLHMEKISRILYVFFLVLILSIYGTGRKFYVVEMLTGRHSIFNQVFVKMGWAWTLGLCCVLKLCTLPLYSKWPKHLLHLVIRATLLTCFFYFWCHAIFPLVEYMTGRCVSSQIIQESYVSRSQCVKSKDHQFYAFDISGHAFLMTFCLFVVSEESRSLKYILALRKELSTSSSGESVEAIKNKPIYSEFNVDHFQSIMAFSFPFISLSALSITILSLIWDLMLIITSLYYHTFFEKIIGCSLAIATWYGLYPTLFKAYNIL